MPSSPAPGSPESWLRAYFDALEAHRFGEAVRYLDPASVENFHREVLGLARAARLRAMDDPRAQGDPPSFDMLDEVFGQDLWERAATIFEATLRREYAGVETLDELLALGPAELLERHLRAQTPEHQREQTIREGRTPLPEVIIESEARRVLGAVMEGDALAHVVFRSSVVYFGGQRMDRLHLATLRRGPSGWHVTFEHLPPGIENVTYGYQEDPQDEFGLS